MSNWENDRFSRPNYKSEAPFKIRDLGQEAPITELYAALAVDENGNEGILSVEDNGNHMPLVFGYNKSLPMVRELAMKLKGKTTKQIRIVKFGAKEILETL